MRKPKVILSRWGTAIRIWVCRLPPRAIAQVPRYDLLLKGGHVIDPANGLDAKMDVPVSLGKIAAVEKDIPAANQAGKVVDVSSLYVTSGLIDIHYHIGHGGAPLDWFAPDSTEHELPVITALLGQ